MKLEASAGILIRRPPQIVFDFITSPDAVSQTFRGWGPIPGAERSEIVGGGPMGLGSIRRVANTDGSVVSEEIVEFERPRAQAYRLVSGLKPPLTWLVRSASGRWTLSEEAGGTRIHWVFTFEPRQMLFVPLVAAICAAFRRAMKDALEQTRARIAHTEA